MIDHDRIIHVATIPPTDTVRVATWRRLFGAIHVPVTKAEPDMTILPSGEPPVLCYFVDFSITGDEALAMMIHQAKGAKASEAILAMLGQRIYPLVAAEVTVVTGRAGMWHSPECNQSDQESRA